MRGPVVDEGLGALIDAARTGDRDAFSRLASPHVGSLRDHCARIVGNVEDGQDALQDTLLRAWLGLDGLRDEHSLRPWLYTIATNTSLNLLRTRRRAAVATDSPVVFETAAWETDDTYERRESVANAFATAIQRLPPRQRAVLILRDALALSASEVAVLLNTTTASVNSALQRARASIAATENGSSTPEDASLDDLETAVLSSYVAAWEETDILRIFTVARADAVRTTLIERLSPRGGGWVNVANRDDWERATFRPVFALACGVDG